MAVCIACGKSLEEKPEFVLEHAPASAQNIPAVIPEDDSDSITLRLCRCRHCGLVQLDVEPVDYYRDVIRAGGYSTTMKELRRRQYSHLIETYHLEGKKFIEIGCGQGEFLSVLRDFPVEIYGIEHKAELVDIAVKSGLQVWRDFADDPGQVLCAPDGTCGGFDVFLSFNFLEHQPHAAKMLRAIHHNLKDGGMGLLTAPGLEYILEQGGYYELLRDHISYFTMESLQNLLEQNGFAVLEKETVNRDTLAVIVRKKPLEETIGHEQPEQRQKREDSGQPEDLSVLKKSYQIVQEQMDAYVRRLVQEGKSFAMWGASHQGFTLAATTAIGTHAKYIIDSAPFKQGRFAPSSRLPILSPDDACKRPVDAIMIAAPGYTEEIAGIIRERFGTGVEIVTMRTSYLERL